MKHRHSLDYACPGRVRHDTDTDTCNYTELCDFQIIRCVGVSVSVSCPVSVSVLYRVGEVLYVHG